jgi:hypothetical protein
VQKNALSQLRIPLASLLAATPGRKLLLSASAQLSIARAKLLDERCINLHFNASHVDLLRFIPPAHLGQHLGGFESIGRAGL